MNALIGAGIGLLAGGIGGFIVGARMPSDGAGSAAIVLAAIVGVVGAVVGALIGWLVF
jgi:hypothetical protein